MGWLEEDDVSTKEADFVGEKGKDATTGTMKTRGKSKFLFILGFFPRIFVLITLLMSGPLQIILTELSKRSWSRSLKLQMSFWKFDAHDSLGTCCPDMEKMVMKASPNKHLVLLLNKIGLI